MEEPNNCPKPNCGRPESTHRYSAGKKLSICGNGHSWDAQEVAEQRAKARDAERQEISGDVYGSIYAEGAERMKRELDRLHDRLTRNPFL